VAVAVFIIIQEKDVVNAGIPFMVST
jgi:hypothetical protein